MSELQKYLTAYINCLVEILTERKEEFFLSLCDVDEELLSQLDPAGFHPYRAVIISNRNYSEAVRLRNDERVSQIVLLSGEGVKQIDSLKDFNEYSIMGRSMEDAFRCLEKALDIKIRRPEADFLSVILDRGEITLRMLLEYLSASVRERKTGKNSYRSLYRRDLNRNLPMLKIWKSNKADYLTKGEIGRMIRNSRITVVENKLTKAIMNNAIKDAGLKRQVTSCLASGEPEKLFEKRYYREVEGYFKGKFRNLPGETPAESASDDILYESSYQYLLLQNQDADISEIEEEWMESREENADDLEVELDWDCYKIESFESEEAEGERRAQYRKLSREIKTMNLPDELVTRLLEKLESFWKGFEDSLSKVRRATPLCLEAFCTEATEYTQNYIELLAYLLQNGTIRRALTGTVILEDFQKLLCRVSDTKIEMPYYHPLCVIYFMGIRRQYQYILEEEKGSEDGSVHKFHWPLLLSKTGMQFPVEYIVLDRDRKYSLDYTTVWRRGVIEFTNANGGSVYSALDVYAVSRQILDYMEKHPFLTSITIAMVDISDLAGLPQLVERILHGKQLQDCNIGRVEFLILSAKEEELRRKLAELWDIMETEGIVRFRFGRNEYWDGSSYDMKKIVDEADMTIIADNFMLYQEPRMVVHEDGSNSLWTRLNEIRLEDQVERFFKNGVSDIPILWNTLHQVMQTKEEGFWTWKNKEVNNGLLAFINETVSDRPDKAILLLSSNEHILSELFKTQFAQVHRGKYGGKSITLIHFEKINGEESLSEKGEARIAYSLKDFYDSSFGLTKWTNSWLKDVTIEISPAEERYRIQCRLYAQGGAEDAEEGWKQECEELFRWQVRMMLSCDNVLGNYFRESLLHYWLERLCNLESLLMVRRFCREDPEWLLEEGLCFKFAEEEENEGDNGSSGNDNCMEVLKLWGILKALEARTSITERMANQLRERYGAAAIRRLWAYVGKRHVLEGQELRNLRMLYERIKED